MAESTPTGMLDERDQQEQDALDQAGLLRRLVTIAAIRAEVSDNPNLTDAEGQALEAASDAEILDAIDSNARTIEDRLYALHDELQALVVNQIAAA